MAATGATVSGHAAVLDFILPVSGASVQLHEPTGADDLLLADYADDPRVAHRLLTQLDDAETDWAALPVHDVDTAVLRLRHHLLGDRIATNLSCAHPGCGARIEIAFGVRSYLHHHRPRAVPLKQRGWRVDRGENAGQYALAVDGAAVLAFRLPTLEDQIAVAGQADAAASLAQRCIPVSLPHRMRARIDAAMTALAPPLAGPLEGRCPDCGAVVTAWFEARSYCLRELGFRARFLYDDVDVLAQRYHWSEQAILAMPYARRTQYAERARQAAV